MPSSLDAFADRLADYCRATFGDGELADVRRLSGGASMESWAFDYADEPLVLRRLPPGFVDDEEGVGGISLAAQAKVIRLAEANGVTAPVVRGELADADGLGVGFVMARASGETLPQRILGKPGFAQAEARLADQCAAELAAIHALDTGALAQELDHVPPAGMVRAQRDRYDAIGGDIPIYEAAFRWLLDTAPDAASRSLVHGDFRMGNLMIDAEGISAVLDWELAHLGDPLQDLAYLCTPSWRFGRYDKEAGGFADAETFLAAYERASGTPVNRARFRWWLIYSTLWWGVACFTMGDIWRSHNDRSLERTVIGRRVSEVEIDLALLFMDEGIVPGQPSLDWAPPAETSSTGETGYDELLTALAEWNEAVVQLGLSGHDRFQSKVAGNALGIAKRRETWGGAFADAADRRLSAIGCSHRQLCSGLRSGAIAPADPGVWDHLRRSALERLSIDQPKYPGLHAALSRWSST